MHARDIALRRRRRVATCLFVALLFCAAITILWIVSTRRHITCYMGPLRVGFCAGGTYVYINRPFTVTDTPAGTETCFVMTLRVPKSERKWIPSVPWKYARHASFDEYRCALGVLFLPFAAIALRSVRNLRRLRRRGVQCIVCGYALTGNVSGVCPECGTPFRDKHEMRLE